MNKRKNSAFPDTGLRKQPKIRPNDYDGKIRGAKIMFCVDSGLVTGVADTTFLGAGGIQGMPAVHRP